MTAGDPHAHSGRAWATPAVVVVFLASMSLLVAAFAAFTRQPWSMLDLRVYLWGGGALLHHTPDPYLRTYLGTGLRFTYTPLAAGLFALLAAMRPHVVAVLVTVASVASLLASLWLTWGMLERSDSGRRLRATLAIGAVALWLEPIRQTLSFGQVNLLLMAVVVADLSLPDTCRWKGVGVGLAAGFKLTPLIFVPYLVLTRRFRAAAVAAATFGVTVAGSGLVLPQAVEHYWLDGLFLDPSRVGNVRYIGNQSLYGAIERLAGSDVAARPYQLAAAVIVGTAGLALAARASRRGEEVLGIVVCAVTGLLVSPISWSHHWVWVAPVLALLADRATRPPAAGESPVLTRMSWAGAAVVIVVFSGLLWAVPPAAAQGGTMTGAEQFAGDLYVLAALAGLSVIAGVLAVARHRAGPRGSSARLHIRHLGRRRHVVVDADSG